MVKATGQATARAPSKANPLRISHLKNRKHGPRLLLKNISSVIFRNTGWKRKTTRKVRKPLFYEQAPRWNKGFHSSL